MFVHWRTNDSFIWKVPNETMRAWETLFCWIEELCTCSTRWIVLGILIHTRKSIVPLTDIQSCGLGGIIVNHLVRTIPTTKPTHLFTDKYFTRIVILAFLMTQNIFLTGTVVSNRTDVVVAGFPKDIDVIRESSVSWTRDNEKVSIVKWKNNKPVHFLSSILSLFIIFWHHTWMKL